MARKVNVVLVDDLSGEQAAETVLFGLDGKAYEIDLSERNAKALRDALAPWIVASRRVETAERVIDLRAKAQRPVGGAADIRRWASERGIPVSRRGRLPASVRAQFEAAHR